MAKIEIRGARVNTLKNIDLDINDLYSYTFD